MEQNKKASIASLIVPSGQTTLKGCCNSCRISNVYVSCLYPTLYFKFLLITSILAKTECNMQQFYQIKA